MKISNAVFAALLFFSLTHVFKKTSQAEPTSQTQNLLFSTGNKLYEEGKFTEALETYLSIYNQNYGNALLYYNLGNTYYRLGDRGKSVLWFERALQLKPRDADIRFNLLLAKSHIKDQNEFFFHKYFFVMSMNEISLLLAVVGWIFFISLGFRFALPRLRESGVDVLVWTSGIFLISLGALFYFQARTVYSPQAIVVEAPGEVRNGPGEDYAVGFTLPEGSRVVVLHKRPNWMEVGVPQQGLKGWIPAKSVEFISLPILS